ncbi:MAG: VCBS repeat-containing protein [Myxococcaceae bacterium]|nr:VCBS repeat-containing protein [Myxococcaceae bacterium]
MSGRGLAIHFLISLAPLTAIAQANAGVSDERVSLPQAPGSVSGVGENASVEGNHGGFQFQVPVEVPPGFPSVTPDVSLSYSSMGGASVVGLGWTMATPSIERHTARGLPKYDTTDRFAVDGASELVQVASSTQGPVFRARFEGGFVRYTWLGSGTGEGGSWKAEYPNGNVGYFGADKQGAAVPAAQITGGGARVFQWNLVLLEDVYGHQQRLTWTKDASGTPLLERIEYLFEGNAPRHSVRFTYEDRSDVSSDAQPGVEVRLTKRLKEIGIYSGVAAPEQVRRYALEFEPDATSGFSTRLRSVTRFGRSGSAYPVKYTFSYTKTLGGLCDATCDKPFVHSMGMVAGVDFASGRASMVDINGDAIPDIVVSDAQGQHRFIYGKLDAEGRASFMSAPVTSARTMGSSPFVLGDPRVQLMDVNGDGFVDITQAMVPTLLCNDGSGDWVEATRCRGTAPGLPPTFTPEDDVAEAAQHDPKYVRFFDYDNDKRTDWLRTPTGGTQTEVLANEAAGFRAVPVDLLGAVFDEDDLQLADMNGDGLQDPVRLRGKGTATLSVDFKLNLGFGRWAPAAPNWRTLSLSGLNPTATAQADLEDLNGDGLADIVMVAGNEVSILLNRNGDTFSAPLVITTASLGSGTLPGRVAGTTVTYADMNGNGSADIVWFQPTGSVQYLELFPVRPNLISRIENGLGSVQLISFGTSISEQARDAAAGRAWPTRVPNASILVTKVDSWVTLTGTETGGLHERMVYRYHDGFYDGVEKQFRGYETVERELLSDATRDAQEPGVVVEVFEVGRTDPSLAGLLKTRTTSALSGMTVTPLREERLLYQLCPVAEVGMASVKWQCQRATTTVLYERQPSAALTLRSEQEYDGYGNVIRSTRLGVVNLGTPEMPRGCQACVASGAFGKACGDMCLGDEDYAETTYIAPGADTSGRWMLSRASRTRSGAQAGMLNVETQTFYDGPAFTGLASGQLALGAVTRVSQRTGMGATDFIDTLRVRRDVHGNVAEQLEPHGTLAAMSHRRLSTYEAAGLHATQVEVKLSATRSLRRDTTWDYAFEKVGQSSNWYAVEGGVNLAAPQQTRYRYDEHGRLDRTLEPGDADATASTEYQYQLADPASRILTLKRSSATSGQDLVSAQCLDGRGRVFQTRQRITDTSWQVSGFTEFDSKGAAARVFQPYLSMTGACELAPPSGVPFLRTTYDVLRRPLVQTEPDMSTRRTEYEPLVTRTFDEDDTDMTSPAFNTPTLEESDGLGRLVRIERQQPSAVTQLSYDVNGRLATVKDAAGNALAQQYDLAGRLVQVTNPNSGVTRFEYDAAGNVLRRVDARNVAVRTDYDALSRPVAQWDEAKEAATKVRWSYDALMGCADCTNAGGQTVQTEWPMPGGTGRDRFGFDVRGDSVFFERTVDGKPLVVRARFDQAHRQTAVVYPAGLTVESAYDGASRLASMPNLVRSVEYNPRGLVSGATFTNNVSHRFEYDTRLRLSRQAASTADGNALFDLSFTRTRGGNLTTIVDAATRADRARHAVRFTSDGWDRVTSAVMERATGDAETLSFAYDTIDNVTSQSSSLGDASAANVGAYSYDASKPNAVKKAGALDYQYDAAGFMTARGTSGYEFDHLGRLVRATRDGAETGSFVFGAGPLRVLEREGDVSTTVVTRDFEVRDGIAVVYARLGGTRVARMESDALAATLLSDLAPLTGSTPTGDGTIDIGDAWVAQSAATGGVSLTGGPTPSKVQALLASAARRLLLKDVTWLHADHQGSVVAATNGQGALVAEQSFYPWGEVRSSTGFVDSHGFTGQERDSSTGLIHFQFRELDPKTGRWASVDPAFAQLSAGTARNGESLTAYAYVGNDFADKIDPTGLAGRGGKVKAALRKLAGKASSPRADRNRRGTEYISTDQAVAGARNRRGTEYISTDQAVAGARDRRGTEYIGTDQAVDNARARLGDGSNYQMAPSRGVPHIYENAVPHIYQNAVPHIYQNEVGALNVNDNARPAVPHVYVNEADVPNLNENVRTGAPHIYQNTDYVAPGNAYQYLGGERYETGQSAARKGFDVGGSSPYGTPYKVQPREQ